MEAPTVLEAPRQEGGPGHYSKSCQGLITAVTYDVHGDLSRRATCKYPVG